MFLVNLMLAPGVAFVVLLLMYLKNRGLADPIVHYVTGAGANIFEIQMYDRDSAQLFAMLMRIEWPATATSVASSSCVPSGAISRP